ncbi:MAG TPA: 2-C-methyl-D-erythritol 4-phosphate cytidylyltransferase, partial [Gemmatimonadales bacterium]|nr:2-C-methyl-D-erythritol 4-phosphate cytidylyltransferase [Gemmatimonadales bacterium]
MRLPRDVGVVVVAAGQGLRAGGGEPKQFRPIAGVPMLLRALRPVTAHPDVAQVVVVLPADLIAAPPDWLA